MKKRYSVHKQNFCLLQPLQWPPICKQKLVTTSILADKKCQIHKPINLLFASGNSGNIYRAKNLVETLRSSIYLKRRPNSSPTTIAKRENMDFFLFQLVRDWAVWIWTRKLVCTRASVLSHQNDAVSITKLSNYPPSGRGPTWFG